MDCCLIFVKTVIGLFVDPSFEPSDSFLLNPICSFKLVFDFELPIACAAVKLFSYSVSLTLYTFSCIFVVFVFYRYTVTSEKVSTPGPSGIRRKLCAGVMTRDGRWLLAGTMVTKITFFGSTSGLKFEKKF